MTKLREIADKLGLPIGKEFRLDDEQFNKLVFKIDEEGNILFWNDNTVKFVLSSWSLIDIYNKGYVLVDENKQKNKEKEYHSRVLNILDRYLDSLELELYSAISCISISDIKELKENTKELIEETQRRLLNK